MDIDDIPLHELKKAVALKYNGDDAPVITAKGINHVAEEIIQAANDNGVPLCDNPALIDLLSRLDVGEEVPKELYVSVAYILAFAYDITYRFAGDTDSSTAKDI